MKKSLLVFALICLALVAFAQSLPLSVGVGANFSPVFIIEKAELLGVSDSATVSNSSFGAKAFFDAKYIELGLGIAANSKTYSSNGSSSDGEHGTWLAISALGKYPIELGSATIFPIGGIEYGLNLSYKAADGTDIKSDVQDAGYSLDQFWVKGGLGVDFAVSSNLYIRSEALVGYKFKSKMESDLEDLMVASGLDSYSITTLKIDLSLAIGYKL